VSDRQKTDEVYAVVSVLDPSNHTFTKAAARRSMRRIESWIAERANDSANEIA
jgi:hypothetical protein